MISVHCAKEPDMREGNGGKKEDKKELTIDTNGANDTRAIAHELANAGKKHIEPKHLPQPTSASGKTTVIRKCFKQLVDLSNRCNQRDARAAHFEIRGPQLPRDHARLIRLPQWPEIVCLQRFLRSTRKDWT